MLRLNVKFNEKVRFFNLKNYRQRLFCRLLNKLVKPTKGLFIFFGINKTYGGARGVVVIVVGIGHGDTSLNPGRD